MTTETAATIRYEEPLVEGELVRRYKRFLADVRLEGGEVVTAHCMNPGAMTGCADPGSRVWLSRQDKPHRKLKWTWEIASAPGGALIGVNTQLPNRLVSGAIAGDAIEPLAGYASVRTEVRTGQSRIDVLAEGREGDPRPCWVEIKNVTLRDGPVARFPDAQTARGRRHLRELAAAVEGGARAVMFYLVQRLDVSVVAPAWEVDPEYGEGLRAATAAGVEVLAWQAHVTPEAVTLTRELPFELEG